MRWERLICLARIRGLLRLIKKIYNINLCNLIYITVVHNNFEVKENQLVGKIFQIPANIEKKLFDNIISNTDTPLISIKPYISREFLLLQLEMTCMDLKKKIVIMKNYWGNCHIMKEILYIKNKWGEAW